ncbi:MAG: hypothetical protein M1153_02560 [Patescibacteria group bacterium]|nr:hypothetical protein [Patescibacteria group bacterium]
MKNLEKYKERLLGEKKKIEDEIKDLRVYDMGSSDEDRHGEEKADEIEEFMNASGEIAPLEARLEDIKIALDKMSEGTYGLCEKCHKEIDEKVLEVDPESRLCQVCKSAE